MAPLNTEAALTQSTRCKKLMEEVEFPCRPCYEVYIAMYVTMFGKTEAN